MEIESKKTFKTGFVLKEPDLRRLVDTVHEQFAKLPGTPKSSGTFRLKLRNGAMLDSPSLDEVLSLENGGSSQLVRLKYEHKVDPDDKTTHARFEFINVDIDEESSYTSMQFQVNGANRDWVFVSSSLLEERCERLRRFALNQISGKGPTALLFRLIPSLITLLVVVGMLMSMFHSIDNRPQVSKLLEGAIQAGTVKEPIDAILFVQKQQDRMKFAKEIIPIRFFIGIGVFLLLGAFAWLFLLRYYPVYNFCWGEYAEEFQRKESRRQFWLVIIVIGLVVSFFGSVFANNVGTLKKWFGP